MSISPPQKPPTPSVPAERSGLCVICQDEEVRFCFNDVQNVYMLSSVRCLGQYCYRGLWPPGNVQAMFGSRLGV